MGWECLSPSYRFGFFGCSQLEFMIYFNINNIDINDNATFIKMVHQIRNLIIKNRNNQTKILTISIHDIAQDDNSIIPKLEYKKIDIDT